MATDALTQLKEIKLELADMLHAEEQDVTQLQRLVTRYRILIPASYEQLRATLPTDEYAEMLQQEQHFLQIIQSVIEGNQKETKATLLKLSKGRKAKNAY